MSTKADDRTLYGGQAVIEGVMMRSQHFFAIACRRLSDKSITVKLEPVTDKLRKLAWLNKPFLRGSLALVDAFGMGYRALIYSANVQVMDEDVDQTAAALRNGNSRPQSENNPPASSKVSAPISGIAIGATTVIAMLIGIGLFWTLPAAAADYLFSHGHSALPAGHLLAAGVSGRHLSQPPMSAGHQLKVNLVEGLIRIAFFLGYVGLISRLGHVKRVFEYHGAEHKAINTLEAGLPLTIENARLSSRIHPRCGTNFIFIVLITAVLVFSFIPRHGITDGIGPFLESYLMRLLLLPVVAGISFEILKLAGKYRHNTWARVMVAPGLWTQYLTTRVPDDSQIEVALAALLSVWNREHESSESLPLEPAVGIA